MTDEKKGGNNEPQREPIRKHDDGGKRHQTNDHGTKVPNETRDTVEPPPRKNK